MNKVVRIDQHPRRVMERLRAIAQDLSRIDYDVKINDLVRGQSVSMSAIWACLEQGEIMEEHLHFEPNGTYAKIAYLVADTEITIDVLLQDTATGGERLIVLWADQIEEE